MSKLQSFKEWHSRHGCTAYELWKMQNMLGSCVGLDSKLYKQAQNAWQKSDRDGICEECGEPLPITREVDDDGKVCAWYGCENPDCNQNDDKI